MNNLNNIALLAVVALASLASAQQGGGRGMGMGRMGGGASVGGRIMLLQRDDVKADLAVTDEQKSKLAEYQTKTRDRMREMFQGGQRPDPQEMATMFADMNKKALTEVGEILTPAQNVRLKEIAIQMSGSAAAQDPEIAKSLGVTIDQKAKMEDLMKKAGEARQTLFTRMRNQEVSREEMGPIMEKIGTTTETELAKILTPAQKEKLKTMGGKTFVKTDAARN